MILTLLGNLVPFVMLLITWTACRASGNDNALIEAKEVHRRNMAGNYEDLEHESLTFTRVVGLCLVALLFGAMSYFGQISWWLVPCLLALGWSGFVTKHRWTINRELKKNEAYMSPGNRYDWFWIRSSQTIDRITAVRLHRERYNHDPYYASNIHRAGRIAYFFEYTVAVVAMVLGIINAVQQWEPLVWLSPGKLQCSHTTSSACNAHR